MTTFFAIARLLRAAYKALRAAVGILLVAHGTFQWAKKKRAAALST